MGRFESGLGNLQPIRLDRVYEKWTRNKLNIWIGLDILGHRLNRSELSNDFGSEEQHRRNQPQTQRTHLTCHNNNPKQVQSNNTKNTTNLNLRFKSNSIETANPNLKLKSNTKDITEAIRVGFKIDHRKRVKNKCLNFERET